MWVNTGSSQNVHVFVLYLNINFFVHAYYNFTMYVSLNSTCHYASNTIMCIPRVIFLMSLQSRSMVPRLRHLNKNT